jgi:hypothetical protein
VFFLALTCWRPATVQAQAREDCRPTLTKKKITDPDEIDRQAAAFLPIRIVITIILSIARAGAAGHRPGAAALASGGPNIIPTRPGRRGVIVAVIALQFEPSRCAAHVVITAVLTTIELLLTPADQRAADERRGRPRSFWGWPKPPGPCRRALVMA